MRFAIEQSGKRLIFDSDLHGLRVRGVEYTAGRDGVLIYDQVIDLQADEVELQLSTNTSTLIPALRILGFPYHSYFDERPVIESQNDITFYWQPSRLAAFYNEYSTDELDYADREPVVRRAVEFLTTTVDDLPLNDAYLTRMLEPCMLLGFYQGFPIFDSEAGFAKLQSRLGIHVGTEDVMISTPMDRYERDVYELADLIRNETGLEYSKKKNRVVFPRSPELMELLAVDTET
jgi:hypothetical protein